MRRSSLACATLALVLAAGSACGPRIGPRPAGEPTAGAGGQKVGETNGDPQFCALAKQLGAQNLQVFDGDSTTPEQQRQVLLNVDKLTAAAPDEIHADFV